jgi:hypothetical protein
MLSIEATDRLYLTAQCNSCSECRDQVCFLEYWEAAGDCEVEGCDLLVRLVGGICRCL